MKPLKIRMEHFLLYLLYVKRMENLKLFYLEKGGVEVANMAIARASESIDKQRASIFCK